MKDKLAFLTSTRFWKLVIIGILEALVAVSVIDAASLQALTDIVQLILGGSIAIRTVDRFGEKTGSKDTGVTS